MWPKLRNRLRLFLRRILVRILGLNEILQAYDDRLSNFPYEYRDQQPVLPKVATKEATLAHLLAKRLSVARYGDGELALLQGTSIPFQAASPALSRRLAEILVSTSKKVMVCLPDTFGNLDDHMPEMSASFWRAFWPKHRQQIYAHLDLDKQYYSTYLTRPYISFIDKSRCAAFFKEIKKVWHGREVVIVEGHLTRFGMGNDLLANARSVRRILCPALNAFEHYDKILARCLQENKDRLLLIALGPTATVLAYDLALKGYQSIDIGHLDVEYEWFLRGATTRIKIPRKYVLEAGGTSVGAARDDAYQSQIADQLF